MVRLHITFLGSEPAVLGNSRLTSLRCFRDHSPPHPRSRRFLRSGRRPRRRNPFCYRAAPRRRPPMYPQSPGALCLQCPLGAPSALALKFRLIPASYDTSVPVRSSNHLLPIEATIVCQVVWPANSAVSRRYQTSTVEFNSQNSSAKSRLLTQS